jgi:hypothetical protein
MASAPVTYSKVPSSNFGQDTWYPKSGLLLCSSKLSTQYFKSQTQNGLIHWEPTYDGKLVNIEYE